MKIINKTNIVIVLRNPGNIVRQGEKGCRDWKEKKKKQNLLFTNNMTGETERKLQANY